MRKLIYHGLILFVLGGLVIYCEKKPEKELQDAQNAINELEQMGAPQYIPDEWNAIKSKFEDAKAKIERRKYKEAKEALLAIISEVPNLKAKIEEKKKEEEERKAQEQQMQQPATAPEGATEPTEQPQ